jgi:hypothetical protein
MQPNMQAPRRSFNLGQARRLPEPTRGGSSSRPSLRPSLPPKGWCWHRGAKLYAQSQVAVWHCSTCQNTTALSW